MNVGETIIALWETSLGSNAMCAHAPMGSILQDALRNNARWVAQADGVEVWLPENHLGNLC